MFHRWRPRVRRWGRSSVRSVSTSQHSSKVGTCNRIVRESYRVTYSPLVAIEPVIKDVRCKSNRKVISVTTFRLQPEDVDLPRGRACALRHHGEPRPQPQPPDDAPALPLAHQTGKAKTWKLFFENILHKSHLSSLQAAGIQRGAMHAWDGEIAGKITR